VEPFDKALLIVAEGLRIGFVPEYPPLAKG